MNLKILITMGILSTILGMFGCKGKSSGKESKSFFAKQITITQLDKELELLRAGKTEFDFIGITSNGVDCIYFIKSAEKFNIEFEAMTEDQIPFVDKLKEYAGANGFQYIMTTYGNKPDYKAADKAPVIRIETNTNLSETAKIGEDIERNIFGNNNDTKYEVVP